MLEDYDGLDVLDAQDESVGTVERSYVDDRGRACFAEVKMRGLRSKHRLVPVDDIERGDNYIKVGFDKHTIEESPDASSAEDALDGTLLDDIRAYYDRARDGDRNSEASVTRPGARPTQDSGGDEDDTPSEGISETISDSASREQEVLPGDAITSEVAVESSVESTAATGGVIRDGDDVIEVPIVEEEIVKRPVVKEVLRIRKSTVSEPAEVNEDVRKEHVEVESEGDARVQSR